MGKMKRVFMPQAPRDFVTNGSVVSQNESLKVTLPVDNL